MSTAKEAIRPREAQICMPPSILAAVGHSGLHRFWFSGQTSCHMLDATHITTC